MTRTKLTSDTDPADGTAFSTGNAAAGANNLVLLFVASGKAGLFATEPSVPTVTFGGSPMVQFNTVTSGDRRLTGFQLTTTQARSGTFDINFNGELQDYCAWSAFAYSDVDTARPIAQSKIVTAANSTALTVALGGLGRNTAAGALILNVEGNVTSGAGFTTIDEVDTTQGLLARNATLQTLDAHPLVDNVSWTWAPAANAAAIVVEIATAPPPPRTEPHPHEALIRRFEPILFLHQDEKFVPVNAKRFVESAALWSTGTPPHNTAEWGDGPTGGGVYPRRPSATGLSADSDEPGTYIGALPAGAADSRESFLELGGWNDRALSHESGVLESTANVYADRDAIAVRYESDLKNSRFWYHAEVFDTNRLRSVAQPSAGPDIKPIIAQIPDATLLCYYLFFPAHEQSVQCDSISGIEVSSHAGDWQCLAILLQGDPGGDADRYQPRYIGMTGSRPAPGSGFDGYDFDDEELTAMKVAPWVTAGPGVTAMPTTTAVQRRLHPHVYVSLGSHSFWPTDGEHAVDPYPADATPHDCGGSDSVGVIPPPSKIPGPFGPEAGSLESVLLGLGAWLGKMIAGGKAGAVAGPTGSAAGVIAGHFSGVFELIDASTGPFGVAAPDSDTARPDSGPASGTGTTIAPVGVVVPGAGPTIVAWQTRQGATLDGVDDRTYDYVVDRNTQFWWPNDDNERGYHGRWGQRVTDDTLPRRSGPRFPNYAKMFFVALADLTRK